MGCSASRLEQAKKYLPGRKGGAGHDADDIADILQKLTAAKQNAAAKVALKMLLDVAETDGVQRGGQVGEGCTKLVAWVSSKDPEVKANALNCCAAVDARHRVRGGRSPSPSS